MPSPGGPMPQGAARRFGTDRRHQSALPGQAGKTVAANGNRLNPEGLGLNAKFELQRGLTGYQSAVVSPKLSLSGADTAGRHTAVFPRGGLGEAAGGRAGAEALPTRSPPRAAGAAGPAWLGPEVPYRRAGGIPAA